MDALLTPQPVNTYFEPVQLTGYPPQLRKSYLRCSCASDALLRRSITAVQADPGWHYSELQAGHDAMLSAPEALVEQLLSITSPCP